VPVARRKRTKKTASRATRGKSRKYTPGELFMAALGGFIILLVVGIILSSVFGG
jgi:hypothetical protein